MPSLAYFDHNNRQTCGSMLNNISLKSSHTHAHNIRFTSQRSPSNTRPSVRDKQRYDKRPRRPNCGAIAVRHRVNSHPNVDAMHKSRQQRPPCGSIHRQFVTSFGQHGYCSFHRCPWTRRISGRFADAAKRHQHARRPTVFH